MRKWGILAFLIVLCLTGAGTWTQPAVAAAALQKGSVSGDVWDLQYRLNVLGYYARLWTAFTGTAPLRRLPNSNRLTA
ncbi:hypothetical protein LJK88_39965 [Paenibacillus sp. P26]|nr:hypothetical protein LJK88_39965 [Paenibacillus sp. P26]